MKTDWITTIDGDNFLGIYDVMLDIDKENNISPHNIIIRLLPSIIRFPQLFPADGTNHRDNYCELRWKAIEFLKSKEIIKSFEFIEGSHRWEGRIKIVLNENPIVEALAGIKTIKFKDVLKIASSEYKVRSGEVKAEQYLDFWSVVHPKIVEVSKSRFDSGHFADSVEAAFKEVNNIVKELVKKISGNEFDGSDLMNTAFSLKKPLIELADLTTETGRNIQVGYMQIFAGSMTGIRNPKAHGNVKISSKEAIRLLHLASMLMYKIDERKKE